MSEYRIYYSVEGTMTELCYGNGELAMEDFNKLLQRGIACVMLKGSMARIGQHKLSGFRSKEVERVNL